MKYYLIVGEASGDLHASHLMTALKAEDPQAEFRFFGGDPTDEGRGYTGEAWRISQNRKICLPHGHEHEL